MWVDKREERNYKDSCVGFEGGGGVNGIRQHDWELSVISAAPSEKGQWNQRLRQKISFVTTAAEITAGACSLRLIDLVIHG